jgi:hypothetical protein
MSANDEAVAVALEHVHWCRCRGLQPADVCAMLRTSYAPRPGPRGWGDAVWLVAGAWLGLPNIGANIKTIRAAGQPARRKAGSAQLKLPGIESPGISGGEIEMGRIRSLHPSQWTEGNFAESSPLARLLLLGLRNEADDHGVFLWNPLSLKLRLLPLDDCDIEALLGELIEHDQIAAYQVDGRGYGICLAWDQQPQHPSYRHPLPPAFAGAGAGVPVQSSVSPPEPSKAFTSPHSDLESESESKKGASRARTKPAPPPQDLAEEWREEAQRQRAERGYPEADLDEQWRRFRTLNAGETDTPARWRGRWLNWAAEAKPAAAGNGAAAPPESTADPPPERARWHQLGPQGDRLIEMIGEAEFREQFAGVRVHPGITTPGTVHLLAPTPEAAERLRLDYELKIRACWRVRRVEIEFDPRFRLLLVSGGRIAPEAGNGYSTNPPTVELAAGTNGAAAPSPARRERPKRARPTAREQPSLLMPLAGGGAGATASRPEQPASEPIGDAAKDPRQRRASG